jgi:hypothetical protein
LKDFKIHLAKRGYKQSEIVPIMQEIISANKRDHLKTKEEKGQTSCTQRFGHRI